MELCCLTLGGLICRWEGVVIVVVSKSKICIWLNNKHEYKPFSLRVQKTAVVLSVKRLPDSLGRKMKIYQILPPLSRMACQTRGRSEISCSSFPLPCWHPWVIPRTMQGERSTPVTPGLESQVFIGGRIQALLLVFRRRMRCCFLQRVQLEKMECVGQQGLKHEHKHSPTGKLAGLLVHWLKQCLFSTVNGNFLSSFWQFGSFFIGSLGWGEYVIWDHPAPWFELTLLLALSLMSAAKKLPPTKLFCPFPKWAAWGHFAAFMLTNCVCKGVVLEVYGSHMVWCLFHISWWEMALWCHSGSQWKFISHYPLLYFQHNKCRWL